MSARKKKGDVKQKARTENVRVAQSTIDAPPKTGAPTPPKGFKAPEKRRSGPSGLTATSQQVRDAADVARELSSSRYTDDFGPRVPSQSRLVGGLGLAKDWAIELAAAESWLAYVRTQYEAAWGAILPLMKQFTPEFRLSLAHDPSIGKRYSQTNDFVNVHKVSAAKAVATKRQKKKSVQKK